MREIVVKENQTVMDIAVQEYGTPMLAMLLVQDNNLAGLTAYLPAGRNLLIRPTDSFVARYFQDRSKIITSGPIDPSIRQGGIGYMQITNGSGAGISDPFIVS
jgi:hypothetical protein